jgi:hypothetical protein
MIVKQAGNAAQSAGILQTLDIGISKNPKAQLKILNILTNTLYSDKIAAVWREYGCNAVDANVEAGRGNQPIEITLPTNTLPEARIRDFGKGMTEYQMENTYSMAGETTKDESDDFIGFMGIGSKAGYAYGDQFTVTSYQKGKKVVYNCFREQGILRMAKLHEGPTDEPDGMEIKVPVRRPDIPEFVSRAERVFRYFKVRPVVKGGTIEFDRSAAIITGNGWRYIGDGKSVVVMGNIGYDIDTSNLPNDFPKKKVSLLGSGVEIDAPIGAVEIAANREGLQYKDDTLKFISTKLGQTIVEIGQRFTDEVKNAKSYWDAAKLYGGLFERRGGRHSYTLRDCLDGVVTWNGVKLDSGSIILGRNYGTYPDGVKIESYSISNWNARMHRDKRPYDVSCRDSVRLILNDSATKKVANGRVRYWIEQHKGETLFVFTFDDDKIKDDYIKDRKLEGGPWMDMSTLPRRPIVPGQNTGTPSAHRAKHQASVVKLKVGYKSKYGDPSSMWWEPATIDTKNGTGVYVEIEKFHASNIGKYHTMSPESLMVCAEYFKQIGLLNQPIYGLKLKAGKTIKIGAGWVKLQDYLNSELEKKFKAEPDLALRISNHCEAERYSPLLHPSLANDLPKGCVASNLIKLYLHMLDPNAKKLAAFRELYSRHQQDFTLKELPKPSHILKNSEQTVLDAYPMLHFAQHSIRGSVRDKETKRAVEYINLIEAVRNKTV